MGTRPVHRTRRGAVLATAVVAVLALLSGCASSERVTATMTSPERPAASELAPDPGAGGFDDLEDFELPDLDLPDDLEVPGLGDLDDLGLDEFGECFDLLFAYSQLVALAMFAGGSDADIDEVLDELEQAIPPELSDELRIVAETLGEASGSDLFDAGGAFSDPEFLEANDAITAWLTTECVEGDGA